MKRRCIFLLTITLCLIVSFMTPVHAVERRTVKAAFPTQTGMSAVGTSGDLTGYNYKYLQNLAEYAGWDIEYVTYDGLSIDEGIMQAMDDLLKGKVDLLGPILQSDDTEALFEFPCNNYGVVYTTLSALEKSNLTSINYGKKSPLKVAVYNKATHRNQEVESYLKQTGISYELVNCTSTEEQIKAVESNKADVLSSITLSYFEGTRAVAEFAPRPYYLVTSKGNTDLIDEMDQAIDKMNYAQPDLQSALQDEFFGDTSGGYYISEGEQKYINDLKTLNVLCAPEYAPYAIKDASGNPKGLVVSLLNAFAKANNIELNYIFGTNMKDMEEEWNSGKYDCIVGLPFTTEYCTRNGLIRSASITKVDMVIYGKQQAKAYEESTVAVYGQFADQVSLNNFKEVKNFDTLEECFQAVQNGQVDYGCTNRLSADYEIYENGYQFFSTPLMGQSLDATIGVSNELSIEFITALNKYIRTLPDSTVTSYLSEATRHDDLKAFTMFVRTQPLTAAISFAVILVGFAILILLSVYLKRSKNWNQQLQDASQAKSEFLARMSHDIRTPMNAILGYTKLAIEDIDVHDDDLLKNDLKQINTSGEFLLGLINDVLDMTKIESNAMTLTPSPYRLVDFEKQITALVEPLCDNKNITFTMNIGNSLPSCISVDHLRFNQIFLNLLSNAVKFTNENGKIETNINATMIDESNTSITIIVKDNGIGMSEEFQKTMFDSFSQEEANDNKREGSGLGLAIVNKLVELMDGTIEVESAVGVGTTFKVTLDAKIVEAEIIDDEEKHIALTKTLCGKRVLLCEDHPINIQLTTRLLEKEGIIVISASDGQIGLETFMASDINYFDLILMDIRMPNMDGLEATRAIRHLDREDAQTIPIVAMTANAFAEDIEQAIEAGMNDHLGKPVEINLLYATLNKYLES